MPITAMVATMQLEGAPTLSHLSRRSIAEDCEEARKLAERVERKATLLSCAGQRVLSELALLLGRPASILPDRNATQPEVAALEPALSAFDKVARGDRLLHEG